MFGEKWRVKVNVCNTYNPGWEFTLLSPSHVTVTYQLLSHPFCSYRCRGSGLAQWLMLVITATQEAEIGR
jgi:hypothetical protein